MPDEITAEQAPAEQQESEQEPTPSEQPPQQPVEPIQEDFGTNARAAEYFDREWDEEDTEQEDRKQREDRKHYRRLLDQYRHILRTVEDQMSKLGTGDAAWVTLRNQERECHQKIKKLELKLYGGYYFDIDDDQRAGWREQLAVQRKNLRRLELQLAKYGSLNAPLSLLNQVDDVKAEIERLERLLKTK